MKRAFVVLTLLVTGAACGKKETTAATPSDAAAAPSAIAPASASAVPGADAGPVIVSLLHHTDAEITLSSRVDNPRDRSTSSTAS